MSSGLFVSSRSLPWPHLSHYDMSVKLVAVQLERLTQNFGRRRRAIIKAFRWFTGHISYPAAYEHPEESRRFTDRGIVGRPVLFDSDKDESGKEGDDRCCVAVCVRTRFAVYEVEADGCRCYTGQR